MTPDCDRCSAARSLQPLGAVDTTGARWWFCSVCSKTVLLAKDGSVISRGDETVHGLPAAGRQIPRSGVVGDP